jgi:hypothetical protein
MRPHRSVFDNLCVRKLEDPNTRSVAVLTEPVQKCLTTANECEYYFIGGFGLGHLDAGKS